MRNLQLCDLKRFPLPRGIEKISSIIFEHDRVFYVENCCLFWCGVLRDRATIIYVSDRCVTPLVYLASLDQVYFGAGLGHVFVNAKTLAVTVIRAPEHFLTASWSPNHEFTAVCGEDRKIRCYRSCYTAPALVASFEDNAHFLPEGIKNVQISWRNDSSDFFASYFDGNIYKIRIFNISGEVVLKNLEVESMIPHVVWRHGTLVCAQKDVEGLHHLSIYERTGLVQEKYPLGEQVIEIVQMQWNRSSDSVIIQVLTDSGVFLNVYTHMTSTFRLKQQIVSDPNNPLCTFYIMSCTKYRLNVLIACTSSALIHKYNSVVQTGLLPNDEGFHAVIDGSTVSLTRINGDQYAGFQEIMQTLTAVVPINLICFHHEFNKLIILDAFNNIFVYVYDGKWFVKSNERLTINNPGGFIPATYYNFCFVSDKSVLMVILGDGDAYNMYELTIADMLMTVTSFHQRILYLKYVPEHGNLLKFKANNTVYLNDNAHLAPHNAELNKLSYFIEGGSLFLITLDVMDELRVNNNTLCRNASSFLMHEDYLYITADVNKLYNIRLTPENIRNICNVPLQEQHAYVRECEDGAVLLCGIPYNKSIILYHTRGNTESVLCRNVAIDQIAYHISQDNWKEAYNFIRVERLDVNLIVDINPILFIDNIGKFVEAVQSQNLLHNFLMCLSEENVLETTYRDVNHPNIFPLSRKKKIICELLLNSIKGDMLKYCKVALICARIIGGIRAAMEVLHHIFVKYKTDEVLTEGLASLNLYYPHDEIRRSCLVKLDLKFVKAVFEKLNVDPKEHESLFEEVERYNGDPHRQFFIIQNQMQNYSDAVQYLVTGCMATKLVNPEHDDTEDVDKMIEYAQNRHVIPRLYKSCVKSKFFNEKIVGSYAGYLMEFGEYQEAGLVFMANGMWIQAADAFVSGKMWKDALLALDNADVDKKEYFTTLAKELKSKGDYRDSALLYEQYLSEAEAAVSCYVDGHFFREAIHCAKRNAKIDLLAGIQEAYHKYYTSLNELITELSDKYTAYFKRLQQVRETPEVDHSKRDSGQIGESAESVAGSIRTATTSRSKFTMSSIRKEQRKKQDLREGGPYENIALMRALHNIISEVYGLCPDVRNVCDLFIACEADGLYKGRLLQDALSNLLVIIEGQVNIIWPPTLNVFGTPDIPILTAARRNLDHLEMKFRYPPEMILPKWRLIILDELGEQPPSPMISLD